MKDIFCGIDFGTSNSTCAIASHNGVRPVFLENTHTTLPSTIFFAKGRDPIYGREALDAYLNGDEGRFMKALKSILGTSLMKEKTMVNARSIDFTDILSSYFQNLKDQIDACAHDDVQNVVLGRPVHFHNDNPEADKQSQDTLEEIARSVGFKNIVFQYEPIAAAFSHEVGIEDEKLSLVIDLGGGTSDFTVIRLSKQRRGNKDRKDDILATAGIRVGGINFDQSLSLGEIMPLLGFHSDYVDMFDSAKRLPVPSGVYFDLSDWSRIDFAQTRAAIRNTKEILRTAVEPTKLQMLLELQEEHLGHALLQFAEEIKIGLSHQENLIAKFAELSSEFSIYATRQKFEDSVAKYISSIENTIQQCLTQAHVKADHINLLILTGGSSELPIINRVVQSRFPNAQILNDNKFGSVGLGLAHYAKNSAFL